jgi:FixJ family two-component response regulator
MPQPELVYVVDDDPSIRKALERLLNLNTLEVRSFESAEVFLASTIPNRQVGCLLLDIRMPGMNGLELQKTLVGRQWFLPIIFLTGFGTIPTTVQAMKHGAFDFIEKPFDSKDLMTKVTSALEISRRQLAESLDQELLNAQFNALTNREKQVLHYMTEGLLNKEIGRVLGITEKTVKVHRASLKSKLQVKSLAELGRVYSAYLEMDETGMTTGTMNDTTRSGVRL